MKYDFAGYATKNDIRCSDGVVIKQNAFASNDGKKVPLVWNHDYTSPENVLGHVLLHNKSDGIYCYGFFNDTQNGQSAKEIVNNGDIVAMSIGARKIKRQSQDVVHGDIYEVSLVLSGANPGAIISESNISHSDEEGESIHFTNGMLFHTANSIPEEGEKDLNKEETLQHEEKDTRTVQDVLDTLDEDQLAAVDFLIQSTLESLEGEGEEGLKQNVFSQGFDNEYEETLTHSDLVDIINTARKNKTTFQDELKHALGDPGTYGVKNIERLFPEAHYINGAEPTIYKDENTKGHEILAATTKSPFSRLKMRLADLTEDEARARGYIKGKEKLEQVFDTFTRETAPQTIYKKQRLDRDDIIDITDFSIVNFIHKEMRSQLIEEIARAILIGDGRQKTDDSKINEDKIRPIFTDHDLFTIKGQIDDPATFIEDVMNFMTRYRGSGSPTLFIDPVFINKVQLLKGTDGRYLTGRPMTLTEIATLMGVKEIVPTTLLLNKGALIVNLADYHVGSTKGGEITNFSDFDIDFNQYKYLIETRICGSLMKPMSAIALSHKRDPKSPSTTPHLKEFYEADGATLKTKGSTGTGSVGG